MAMNKQRRTSNINNIVTYDTLKNVTLPADLTIEGLTGAGFVKSDVNGLLSVDTGAYLPIPSQTGNSGKFLSTDGSVLSWQSVPQDINIYSNNGTLTGNRTLTGASNSLTFTGTNGFIVTSTGVTNEVLKLVAVEPYLLIEAAGGSNAASIFLRPSTSAQNATIQNRNGGGLEFYTGATPTNRLQINANGNVLINTTTDAGFRLDVNGTARVTGQITLMNGWTAGVESTSGSNALIIRTPTSGRYLMFSRGGSLTGYGNFQYAAISNGDSRFTFSSSDFNTDNPPASALINLVSTTQGFLQPRMTTTQRDAITSPATGLSIYNTTNNTIEFYNGTSWVSSDTGTGASGQIAYWTGTNTQAGSATLTYTPTSALLVNNSVTAATAIARGVNMTPTLIAAANNDVLVGLDINPTFTNGAFTGVTNVGLRVVGADIIVNSVNIGRGGGSISSNTAIGSSALSLNVTGANNVAIGFSSLSKSTSSNNVAVGHTTLTNQTSGSNNVAIGSAAMSALTTGGNNIGIGVLALSTITTQSGNVAVGDQSMISATTSNSVAIGINSLRNTTATGNSAIGQNSLRDTTSGANNTSIGTLSMQSNTTGANNTTVGTAAFFANTTGSNNVAIGVEAGRFISGGGTPSTIQNQSIFIGDSTRPLADNQTNQIAIGYLTTGLGSNTTVIGNSSTTFGRWFGRLLLGTSTDAGYQLDVNGTGRFGNTLTVATGGFNVQSGTANFNSYILANGGGSSGLATQTANTTLYIWTRMSGVGGDGIILGQPFNGYGNNNKTVNIVKIPYDGQFTGGTNEINSFVINPVINNTGGTNTHRGIYYNPTLTSLTGTTHRAIETVSGDVVFGSTSGNVLVGTTTNAGYRLDVNGIGRFQNTITYSLGSTTQAITAVSDLTFGSGASITAGSFMGSSVSNGINTFNGNITVANSIIMSSQVLVQRVKFNSTGMTTTMTQGGVGVRALAAQIQVLQFTDDSTTGTLTHGAGMHILAPYKNSGNQITITNYYGIAINPSDEYSSQVAVTNRWGIYQVGSVDNNYFAGKVLVGTSTVSTYSLDVNGTARISGALTVASAAINMNSHNKINYDGNNGLRSTGSSDLIFHFNGSDNIYIGTSGVSINDGGQAPSASAQLQVNSSSRGFLPPRMTGAQAEAIGSPAAGLLVYANNGNGTTITSTGWWGYDGTTWVKLN